MKASRGLQWETKYVQAKKVYCHLKTSVYAGYFALFGSRIMHSSGSEYCAITKAGIYNFRAPDIWASDIQTRLARSMVSANQH